MTGVKGENLHLQAALHLHMCAAACLLTHTSICVPLRAYTNFQETKRIQNDSLATCTIILWEVKFILSPFGIMFRGETLKHCKYFS